MHLPYPLRKLLKKKKAILKVVNVCIFLAGKLPVPSRSCWTLSMKCLLTSQALQANRLWIRRNANSSSTPRGFPIL